MTEAFATLPAGRVLQYHNITPAHFFAPYDAGLFRSPRSGARAGDAGRADVDLALGDSEYNRQELEALGFTNTGVLPIAVDTGGSRARPRVPALEKMLGDGLINFLFVGRIARTRRSRITSGWPSTTSATSTLLPVHLRRPHDGVPRYYARCGRSSCEYQMLPDRFWFTGPVPDEDLAAYYRHASVYVSLSEHEGFCVPLVEAMAADVPVLAYARGGRARDARRRGRAVRAQGSRVRRRTARRALTTTACGRGHRGPAARLAASATRRSIARERHVAPV
jgi:L-malate glycosyltransferase